MGSHWKHKQVKSVLVHGDDEYNNVLVVDFDGFPELIRRVSTGLLTGYPVRFETFSAVTDMSVSTVN